MLNLNSKRKRETLTLIVVFLFVLLVSAFAVYFLAGKTSRPEVSGAVQQSNREPGSETNPAERRPSTQGEPADSLFGRIFATPPQSDATVGGESWGEVLATLA